MHCWAWPVNSVSVGSILRTWAMVSTIGPWFPSYPIGRLRPMTGWRSSYEQRPHARRSLYPDGGHAGLWLADRAARTGGEAADHGLGVGGNFRRRFRPVHVPRQFGLGRAAPESGGGGIASAARPRNPDPNGY